MKKTLIEALSGINRLAVITLVVTIFSLSVDAHNVDSYTRYCTTSTLTLKANVSAVNTSSWYSWQYYKTSTASWVCLVNGSNTINGTAFTVSGTKASNTTTPPDLVISNTTAALDGVIVRLVIRDGGDPCNGGTLYNGGTPSNNFTIQISNSVCAPLCLGNQVFNDADNNGVKGTGETGTSGVTVKLYADTNNDNVADGAAIATTTTDAGGLYQFCGLEAGNYIVGIVPPAGYIKSAVNGGDPDNNTDNDNNGINIVGTEIRGNAITLLQATENNGSSSTTNTNVTYDFGLYYNCISTNPLAAANNFMVFVKGNASVTSGDITGPLAVGGNLSVNGAFAVAGNYAGTYQVSGETAKVGLYVGGSLSGTSLLQSLSGTFAKVKTTTGLTCALSGSNMQLKNSSSVAIVQSTGSQSCSYLSTMGTLDINAAFSVLTDNSNGLKSYADNVTLTGTAPNYSINCTNTVNYITLSTAQLNSNINISSNADATHLLVINVNGNGATFNWNSSFQLQNTNVSYTLINFYNTPTIGFNNIGSTLNASVLAPGTTFNKNSSQNIEGQVIAAAYTHASGEVHNAPFAGTLNTCGTVTGSIGNFVWHDLNANGLQDTNEPGISGVTVQLKNTSGTVIATATTDLNGYYQFTGLAAATYTVVFTTPSGYTPSSSNVGSNDDVDSDPVSGTVTVVLASGASNQTIDAGFYQKVNLGDLVWYDQNGNGVQDAGEAGIAGVTVKLYADANADNTADAAAIATTTTNGSGIYSFTGLTPSNYIVGITIPTGYTATITTATSADPNNDNNTDNNGVTTASGELRSKYITLVSAGEPAAGVDGDGTNGNLTLDFGLKGTGVIGDLVWNDVNGNGVQDSGEQGISGVTVTLTYPNGATTSTTTNTNGIYSFTDLAPGTYSVSFATPAGFASSPANQGSDDAADSDPVNGIVNGITLTAGQTNNTIDAGFFVPLGSIGNKVWDDVNKNGTQDDGELGVAGVAVSLFNNNGVLIASTITDAYGTYLFSNLPVAVGGTNYQVSFSLPAAYVFTAQTQGANTATDSDPNITTGRTGTITLTPTNRDRTDIDAGIYYTIPAKIGDFVWYDANANGIQDSNEPGVAGVTITLYNSLGVVVASTITDNNGYYQFTDLAAGTYVLGISTPIAFNLTTKDQGGNDATDSDFDPATFKTASFSVVNGTVNLTFDAGLVPMQNTLYAAVGDKVWHDINNNGLQDAGEPGVAGVTVQLYTSAGVLVGTRTTDALGYYIFNGLVAGNYYVKFSNFPSGYSLVTANVGGTANVAIDSDVTEANGAGTTATFPLVAGQLKITVDAGIRNSTSVNTSKLGDYVWYDLNKNGVQDAAEAGVPGVTATLYNAATGAVVKSTITDATGKYLFTDLAVGSYLVAFTNIPAGYDFTSADQGSDDTKDSDVFPSTNRTGVYTITTDGTVILTVDAGLISVPNVINGKGSIGDKVWIDFNQNGIQDANEPGVASVLVTLYDAAGNTVATTSTDAYGNYIFNNLSAGSYVVGFSNLPAGYQFTTQNNSTNTAVDSDPNVTTGKTGVITLLAGEINLTIDAGIYTLTPKSTLGDKVWFDVNKNGIQDAGEAGVEGVTVTLYDASGNFIKATATSASGEYLFTDLNAGTYVIGFSNLPAGYTATTQNVLGSNTTNNSDADVVTLKTSAIVLPSNTNDYTWDLGIVTSLKAAVGDYVWNDQNTNGIQDATEAGVAGITVTLYSNGTAITSTVTDANGYYLFSNLEPGTYTIGFSNLPVNATFTTKNASGSTTDNNSDVNVATGKTDAFSLVPGQFKSDVDAGLITSFAAVGDFVWYDINYNGRQDATEAGVPGVLATLYNTQGQKVGSAVTDGSGKYLINNIPVAATTSFTVGFSNLPVNASTYTIKNASGSTAANNSDANVISGITDAFLLQPSQIRLDIDAGVITTTGGPLPVTLVGLKGVYANATSKLSWSTLTEINAASFEIEYSKDGVAYNAVGSVKAVGNSSAKVDYTFNHLGAQSGQNYYRLKLMNKDGSFTYSNVVVINVSVKGLSVAGVYPNPFVQRVNIAVTAEKAQTVSIVLFDNTGKQIKTQAAKVQTGNNTIVVDGLNSLPSGSYILEVKSDDAIMHHQIVK